MTQNSGIECEKQRERNAEQHRARNVPGTRRGERRDPADRLRAGQHRWGR
jgi:hypothetical protein